MTVMPLDTSQQVSTNHEGIMAMPGALAHSS